jgi:hypothetical protein
MSARKSTSGAQHVSTRGASAKRSSSVAPTTRQRGERTDADATVRLLIRTRTPSRNTEVAAVARRVLGHSVSVVALDGPGAARPVAEHFLLRVALRGTEDGSNPEAFDRAHRLREGSLGEFVWVEPDLPQRPSVDTDGGADGRNSGRQERAASGEILSDLCMEKQVPPTDRYWHLRKLMVPQAWRFSEESNRPARGEGIRVGHLDTGWTEHPEMHASLDFVGQYDFVDDDTVAKDPLVNGNPFHGTRTGTVIASTIAGDLPAPTQPFPGDLAGIAPCARLVPIRVATSVAVFLNGDLARGIRHAANTDCHIVSISLGGVGGRALHDAVQEAVNKDVILCAAAGNCVRMVVWPARYAESIAVAATNAKDRPWKGSSRGADVDITAPGAQVWTASRPTMHDLRPVSQGEGTSFAVAGVCGIAALWLAHHGRDALIARYRPHGVSLQAAFRWVLTKTARDIQLPAGEFGAGLADAEAVLRCALPPADVASDALDARVIAADSFDALFADVLSPARADARAAAIAPLRASVDAAERDLLAQEFAQICFDHPNARNAFSRGLALNAAETFRGTPPSALLVDASGIAKYASSRLRSRLASR